MLRICTKMAAVDTADAEINLHRKKRKKGRFIKQGYHRSERHDARRVAARAFLLGITLDSHLQQRAGTFSAGENRAVPRSPGPMSVSSGLSRSVMGEDTSLQTGPPASDLSRRLQDIQLDMMSQHYPLKLTPSRSLEQQFDSPLPVYPLPIINNVLPFDSHELVQTAAHKKQQFAHTRWHSLSCEPSTPSGHTQYGYSTLEQLGSSRLVFVSRGPHACTPFAMHSVLPYNKLRLEYPHPRERARVRANSMSLQLELDGIELGDSNTEVSLGFLLAPLVMTTEPTPLEGGDTPTLSRKQSIRHSGSEKRCSTPLGRYHSAHPVPESLGSSFNWQGFRECHRPTHVLLHYHPLCLDNYEYFVGRNTTTLTPHGYRVSIIQYARDSDVKRGINEQFSEVFPHIKLTLSKLRSIKREMHRISVECELELVAVAYAYVYYEKLVLMGTVNKSNRKLVAGACLLLAAKLFTDIKRPDIIALIDEITDVLRISTKELLLYEFPVLVALQFSLLAPIYQVEAHYDRLKDLNLS